MQTSKDIKTMLSLADYYLHSPQFLSLRGRTQKDYEYVISKVMATPIRHGKNMGELKVDRVTVSDCKTAYQQWLARGVRTANMSATLSSLLFNLAEEFELISRNPMRSIKKLQTQPRKVMWTADQVRLFCDTAYAEYKWRSIGLIVQMAYTFAQRIGDMRSLKWDSINFEERRLDLEQSKKRAEVHLPIHINMFRMLEQQHKDFGFQEFVAPHPFPRNGGYVMYNDKEISYLVNQVKDKARLPKELTAMDMRRTAITEMVEAGVDTTQIMAVSGHNSPNSMRPYIKHTFKSASNALDRRESYKDA
jgi:integrase